MTQQKLKIPVTSTLNRIKEVREAQGISRVRLARIVGMTYQNLYLIERGLQNASISSILRIAYVLNCPVDTLFELTDNEKQLLNHYIELENLKKVSL
jgi:transcriptional regulator with XRE-family HTH domain